MNEEKWIVWKEDESNNNRRKKNCDCGLSEGERRGDVERVRE